MSSSIFTLVLNIVLSVFVVVCYVDYTRREKAKYSLGCFVEAYESENFSRAEECVREAISLNPSNALCHAYLGCLQARMIERSVSHGTSPLPEARSFSPTYNEAIYSLKRALELSPDNDRIIHNLGWLYFQLHHVDSALTAVERSIAIKPSIALYRVSMGVMLEGTGEVDSAIGYYLSAIRLSPEILDSRFADDILQRHQTKMFHGIDQVEYDLRCEFEMNQNPIIGARLGKIYLHNHKILLARNVLISVTDRLPNLNRAWMNLALATGEREDSLGYRQMLERAHILDKSDFLPCLLLGDYCYRNGDFRTSAFYNGIGLRNWIQRGSEHSVRSKRYYSSPVLRNEIIPDSLVRYISAAPDVQYVLDQLSRAARETSDTRLGILCDSINAGSISLRRILNYNFYLNNN